jgi:hypothetical protein
MSSFITPLMRFPINIKGAANIPAPIKPMGVFLSFLV